MSLFTKWRVSGARRVGLALAGVLFGALGCASSDHGDRTEPGRSASTNLVEHTREGTELRQRMAELGRRVAVPVPQTSSLVSGPGESSDSLDDFANRLAETAALVPCLADDLDLSRDGATEFQSLAARLSEQAGNFAAGRREARLGKVTETPYDPVFQAELTAVTRTCDACHQKFLPR